MRSLNINVDGRGPIPSDSALCLSEPYAIILDSLHWRSCFGVRLQHFDIGRSVWLAEEFAILRLCCHFALVYLVERLDIMSTGHCD